MSYINIPDQPRSTVAYHKPNPKTNIKQVTTYSSRSKPAKSKLIQQSNKMQRLFILQHLWIYPLCILVLFFLSDAFLPFIILRVALSCILSIFPYIAVAKLLYGKRSKLLRSQSKVLLQSLCTSVSGGYSLESAFLGARPTLEKAFGKRSLMAQGLTRLEKSLFAHMPLPNALSDFCYHLDYVELLPVMHALSITKVVGNGVISILRNSCQMIAELMSVSSEVDANNAGRNTEAAILCLMPFGVTMALSSFTGEYMSSIKQSPLGITLMLVAFSIAVLSCGFLFSLMNGRKKATHLAVEQEIRRLSSTESPTKKFQFLICKLLPESYITKCFENFSELSCEPKKLFDLHIRKQLTLLLIVTPISLIFLYLVKYPFYFVLVIDGLLIIALHYDIRQKVSRRREDLMEEIPLFLSMLTTLLQSGVLLPKAINICSGAFPDASTLGYEIQIMKAQMLSGTSAGNAIESLSIRTPIPEAQAALLLASRYELTGGSEVLQLLALQSTACWSLCRNASRKKRERDALAMVIPMMLDLISVLIVATTPALLSLQIS